LKLFFRWDSKDSIDESVINTFITINYIEAVFNPQLQFAINPKSRKDELNKLQIFFVAAVKIHIEILLDNKQKKDASSKVKGLDYITNEVLFEAKSGHDFGLNPANYV
jgi:hypothetical protein